MCFIKRSVANAWDLLSTGECGIILMCLSVMPDSSTGDRESLKKCGFL